MNKVRVSVELNFGEIRQEYNVPYERDNDFILRASERDPYSPSSTHEPEVGRSLYADANYEYNYFLRDYELMTEGIDENLLPSLNYYLLHQEGYMSEQLYSELFYFGNNLGTQTSQKSFLSNMYFNEYAEQLRRIEAQDLEIVVNDNNLTSEYISKEAIQVYADIDNKREMFPYFAKVHMTGMPMSQFVGILEEAGMGKQFVDFLIMHREDMFYSITGVTVQPPSLGSRVKVYTYPTFQSHIQNHSGLSYSFGAGQQSATNSCSILQNAIQNQIGYQKLNDYVDRNKNSQVNVYDVETIAYRLEKIGNDGNLINVKYFLNHTDLTDFRLYDTQVSYGVRYNYIISAINLVFQGGKAFFVESPYYNDYFTVRDSPPIQPDVEIVTYRGISDKILILFNQMVDQKVEKPVLINPSDRESFDRQWEAQKIDPENPVLFESDDPTLFEMFRLEERPYSYEDFVNGKYMVIGQENKTSAGHHDMIVPNKTYYYTFRSLDFHQHVSNPTEVYEFKLNKEGETLYPTLQIVDFKPKSPPTQKNISFKKYLKIGLSPSQYQVPESVISQIENISQNDQIDLGTNEEDRLLLPTTDSSPRKFKFRIRSKNTGKLIDVNITFKKNGVFIE